MAVRKLRDGSTASTKYAKELLARTLSRGPVHDGKSLKTLFVEAVTDQICKILRHSWAKQKYASVEDLEQRTEASPNL